MESEACGIKMIRAQRKLQKELNDDETRTVICSARCDIFFGAA